MSAPAWEDELEALLQASRRSGDHDEQVRLLEAAARLADHHGDRERGYQVRQALISAATFGGHRDKALVAFAWCRALAQKEPDRYGGFHLLWHNKWVVDGLPDHPGVSRAQILAAQDDYALAVEQQGGGGKSVAKLRFKSAMDMGELDEGRRWYDVWRDAPRDISADCRACDVSVEVGALVRWERHEEALERAAPIVAGQLACAEVPHATLSWVAMASFALGRLDDARTAFSRGYRMIHKNRKFVCAVGRYLAFLGLTDNNGPALTLLERHLAWALETRAPLNAIPFHLGARFVLERIAASGEATVSLRLPEGFAAYRDDGIYEVHALHDWFDARSVELASVFDARNGNPYYTTQLERSRRWAGEVRPFPVTTGLG